MWLPLGNLAFQNIQYTDSEIVSHELGEGGPPEDKAGPEPFYNLPKRTMWGSDGSHQAESVWGSTNIQKPGGLTQVEDKALARPQELPAKKSGKHP